jgi:hypothetical protein
MTMSDIHSNNDADAHPSNHNGDDSTANTSAVADPTQKQPANSGAKRQPVYGTLARVLGNGQDSASSQPANDKSDATASGDKSTMEDWERESISEPRQQGQWQGLSGISVMLFGVVLPSVLLVMGCASIPKRITLVLLNHPIETLVEMGLLFSIPVVNYVVWSAICKNNIRFSRLRDAALGMVTCASGIVSIICAAGLALGSHELFAEVGTAFSTGFTFMSVAALLAGATACYLINRIRLSRDLPKARAVVVVSAVAGALLCLIAFVAAEARPWFVRIAQRQAVSNSPHDQAEGLERLRWLNPERELRMECADSRAAGLVGMFIPLKSSTQHQLYFTLTGKPYSFRDSHNNDLSSMPDDYLSRHVVGGKLSGLTLWRSKLDGTIHPSTLTSTVHWTMVFKNDANFQQEARAELKMPQGAVITGLRLWNSGEALDGVFAASGKGQGGSTWLEAGHDSPAIVTDLGHNRLLLHCYPVPPEEELKVQVTMAVPLKPDGSRTASIALPRFIATNFELQGEYQLRLRSSLPLSSGAKGLKESTSAVGDKVLSGELQADQIGGSDLVVSAARSDRSATVAVLDRVAVQLEHDDERRKEDARRAQTTNDEQRFLSRRS